MKNLTRLLLGWLLLGSFAAQSQVNTWVADRAGTLTKTSNQRSNTSNVPYCVNCVMLTDATNGSRILSVVGKSIFNGNNQNIRTIASHSTAALKGVTITPVPGGACNEYYILYVMPVAINTTVANTYDAYEVGAVKFSVDASLTPTFSSTTYSVIYNEDVTTLSTNIQTALSPLNNGTRTYYVGFRRSASPAMNHHQIAEIKVDNNGLTANGGFYARSQHAALESRTLEMSPNGQYLAWVNKPTGASSFALMIKDVWSGTTTTANFPGVDIGTDVEFDSTGTNIYITSKHGIHLASVSNLSNYTTLANTFTVQNGVYSSLYYGGDIENINYQHFLVNKSFGDLAMIDNQVLADPNYYNGNIYGLPEQIDGEPIQHYSANIPQVTITQQSGWLIGSATGGSGSYRYQWNEYGDPNYKVYYKLSPCGRYTHTLKVTDLVTGCSATATMYYAAQVACRAKPPLGFRQSTQAVTEQTGVSVYPNPASEVAQVKVPANEQIAQLAILNLQGKTTARIKGNRKAKQSIGVSQLAKGMYILQVTTDKATTQQRLVIK